MSEIIPPRRRNPLAGLIRPMRGKPVMLTALFAGALAITIAGCGGDDDDGGTATATTEATTSATAPAEGSPTAAGSETPGQGTQLELVAKNISFDKTELTAPAGPITITMMNEDNGTPHNLHVFKGTDASGESEGSTEVNPGPNTESLSIDLQPGTYYFHCDVHPTQMFGTLTVQ